LLAFYPEKGLEFAINLRANPSERRKMKEIERDLAESRDSRGTHPIDSAPTHQVGGGG
jgi:hypothetical protein